MPNLMQGRCSKVRKVSEQSTSVEKFVEVLDNRGRAPLACEVLKLCLIQLTRSPGELGIWPPSAFVHPECEHYANVTVGEFAIVRGINAQ